MVAESPEKLRFCICARPDDLCVKVGLSRYTRVKSAISCPLQTYFQLLYFDSISLVKSNECFQKVQIFENLEAPQRKIMTKKIKSRIIWSRSINFPTWTFRLHYLLRKEAGVKPLNDGPRLSPKPQNYALRAIGRLTQSTSLSGTSTFREALL